MRRTTHFYLMVSSVCLILLKGVLPDNTAANNSPENSTALNVYGLSYAAFDNNLCLNDLDDYNVIRQEVISIGEDTNRTQSQGDTPMEPLRPNFVKEITLSSPCNAESTSDAISRNFGHTRQYNINRQNQETRKLYLESKHDIRKLNAREIIQKRVTDNRRCSVLRIIENRRTDQQLRVKRQPYTEKRNTRSRSGVVSERRTDGYLSRNDVVSERRNDRYMTRNDVVSERRNDRYMTRNDVVSERCTDGYLSRNDVVSERRNNRYMTRNDVISEKRTDRYMTRNDVVSERRNDRYMTRYDVVSERRNDRYMTRNDVVSERRNDRYMTRYDVASERRNDRYMTRNDVVSERRNDRYMARNDIVLLKRNDRYRTRNEKRTDGYIRHSVDGLKMEQTHRRTELPSNRRGILNDFTSGRRHRIEDREGKVSSESRRENRREIQPRMIVHSREDNTYRRYDTRSIDNTGQINWKNLENTITAGNTRRRESRDRRESVVRYDASESFYTRQRNRNLPSFKHTTYMRTNIRRNEINENSGSQRTENRRNAQTGSDFEYIKPAEQRDNPHRRRTENISVLKRAPLFIQTSWFMEEVGVARAIFIGFIGIMGRKIWQKQV